MALTDKLTAIANAIREKTGGTELLTLDQMPTEIAGIETGGSGGGASVAEKDVNFYDYDGTVLYAYTVEEAQALTELPALPEREGLICQGWNWSLEDIKAHNRAVNVGAMYITDDGKTRIYITLSEGRTSPMLGVCPNGTVTVDWGDGSEPNVLTGTSTSAVKWTPTHQYASAGDYVISLTVDGTMGFYGSSSSKQYAGILRHSSGADSRNGVYLNAVQKIAIGGGVTTINAYAFIRCCALAKITIPHGVTSLGSYIFNDCISLKSLVIPNGVTSLGNSLCSSCNSLLSVAIPNGITNMEGAEFSYCGLLSSVAIPNSVTSMGYSIFMSCVLLSSVAIPNGVTTINNGTFYGCSRMHRVDFTNHTAVPTLTNTSAFYDIPDDCEIRVPAALYDEWIAATNWSTYASKIVAV